MGASAKKIAEQFIGAAHRASDPEHRREIFKKAAYTFMGLAQDKRNAPSSMKLAQIGADFALAASRERPAVMDDFVDLMQETHQTYQEVGYDQLDLIARRREIHDDRTKPDPGHISIAPSSFNHEATLGRNVQITGAPTQEQSAQGIVQEQNVAFWQGVKKEAQAMTVDVSLGFLASTNIAFNVDTGGALPINSRPYGIVEYGSDGNRQKATFDLSVGTRFTVVGNYIALSVGMNPPLTGETTPVLTAGGSIGTFAAPSAAPVLLTTYVDNLASMTSTEFIPVPLRARLVLPVQTSGSVGDNSQLSFYDIGGNLVSQVFMQQAYNQPLSPIPIPGDAALIRMYNAASGPRSFRIPWQLSL